MVHLSQSLATQMNHFAPLLLPHCQIVLNATGGAVKFSLSVCCGYIPQRTGLLSAGEARTAESIVKSQTAVKERSDSEFLTDSKKLGVSCFSMLFSFALVPMGLSKSPCCAPVHLATDLLLEL